MLSTTESQQRKAWLAERRNGIGASEVGTILGLNPYESPYELYLRKRGELPDKSESLPMWLGHEMEPIIAKRYEMETGKRLHDPGDFAIQRHPDYSWLRATLDRTNDVPAVVELKAVGAHSGDEWHDGSAPLVYQAQVQVQMACAGFATGDIAAIVGNRHFYVVTCERNDDFLDAIIPLLYDFWEGVQSGRPPAVDGSESCSRALRALHPQDNGETIELPGELWDRLREWDELKAMSKRIENRIAAIQNEVIAAMGPNTYGECGGYRMSYKTQTRKSYTVAENTFRVLRKAGS